MASSYKEIEFRLHEYLVQVQDILSLMDADRELSAVIEADKELVRTKKYRLAVMGEFKRGKSSLINALLGTKILPADVEPATATLNRITYGTSQRSEVFFKDGTSCVVPVPELAEYVTKLTPEGAARAARIREAVVYAPTAICQNHVDIIDTPGLNDDERMTRITIELLEEVDAVLVAIHARFPFGETERNFVCRLIKSPGINNLIFVITFLDQLDEDDYEYEGFIGFLRERIRTAVLGKLEADQEPDEVVEKARRMLKDVAIYGVSASLALKSYQNHDRKAFERSRFGPFQSGLIQNLTANQAEHAVRHALADIGMALDGLDAQYQKKMRWIQGEEARLDNPVRDIHACCRSWMGNPCNDESERLEEVLRSLNATKNQMAKAFVKGLSGLKSDLHRDIESAVMGIAHVQYQEMNGHVLPTMSERLYGLIYAGLKEGPACRGREDLEYAFAQMGRPAMEGRGERTRQALEGARMAFGKVRFFWKQPPLPPVPDLSQCNVIESIAEAIDVSVSGCVGELRQTYEEAAMSVSASLREDIMEIEGLADRMADGWRHGWEVKGKAYAENYEVLARTAEDIRRGSQCLLEELSAL